MPIISGGTIIPGALRRVGGYDTGTSFEGASYGGIQVGHWRYSFATEGGAISTIALGPTGDVLPANSSILGGYMNVATIPVGAGASIAVQVEGANDIVTAAAISGAPWSTTGRKAINPVFTAASIVVTTAARNVSVVISGAPLTAGIFDIYLVYFVTG